MTNGESAPPALRSRFGILDVVSSFSYMKQAVPAVLLGILLLPVQAWAQSGYVAGALNADMVRTGSVDDMDASGTGDALSFSLRLGGAITRNFGAEFDFTRPGEIETDQTPDIGILGDLNFVAAAEDPLLASISSARIIGYRIHTTTRTTTMTAALWGRQELAPRVSLVYLGGIAFARNEVKLSSSFDYIPLVAALYPRTLETRTIGYGTGPMAGVEARIGLSEHAQITPGVRMLSVAGGWTIRPGVALAWQF